MVEAASALLEHRSPGEGPECGPAPRPHQLADIIPVMQPDCDVGTAGVRVKF